MQESAYPIFFPTYTPTATGYHRDWWWYDPETAEADSGPFASRSEAVADWAQAHFCRRLMAELQAMDAVLGSPMLHPPVQLHPDIHPALPAFRRALSSQQDLTLCGLTLLAQLDQELKAPDLPEILLQEVSA